MKKTTKKWIIGGVVAAAIIAGIAYYNKTKSPIKKTTA